MSYGPTTTAGDLKSEPEKITDFERRRMLRIARINKQQKTDKPLVKGTFCKVCKTECRRLDIRQIVKYCSKVCRVQRHLQKV